MGASAFTDDSSVYRCRFEDKLQGPVLLRMKKYYDTVEGMYLGKVDVLDGDLEKESTPTKVYQIPLQDELHYIQIWLAPSLRVDAQLSSSQGIREFRGTYNRDSEKRGLICVELR